MPNSASTDDLVGNNVLPVSELVRQARTALESSIPLGWVTGEVSNLTRAASGHIYFTLKDDAAQMRCVMWRTRAQLLPFQLLEGAQIEVRAQLTVYEPRGEMQLSVETIRRAGLGNLYETFLRLKSKLQAEGLFDQELKRPLPRLPHAVGIVTSLAAAALRDVLATLKRRAPGLHIVIYPAQVQGEGAGEQIAAAIATASVRAIQDGVSALIVCRGGGSIEDLWAFNHESVVRAIRACSVPVVSGVGHETDTSLCDFAADLRATTPTAAAEAVSAGITELRSYLPQIARDLQRAIQQRVNLAYQHLDIAQRRLLHPRERLARNQSRLSNLVLRLKHAQTRQTDTGQARINKLEARLNQTKPATPLLRVHVENLFKRLQSNQQRKLNATKTKLMALSMHLDHLNPDAVLKRGYAIVSDTGGNILRSVNTLRNGDALNIRLADGSIQAEVVADKNLH